MLKEKTLLNVSNEFINFGTGNEKEMDSIANLLCWYRMVSPTVTVVTRTYQIDMDYDLSSLCIKSNI